VLTASAKVVCVPGYSAKVRNVPQSLKDVVYARYGLARHAPGAFEVDHLISLELGGSNSLRNLWPQAYGTSPWNARGKDALENRLHALACGGKISLRTAQQAIATDWIAAYRQYVSPNPPAARPATPKAAAPKTTPKPAASTTARPLGAHPRCKDFRTRAEATAYLKAQHATWLDADGDGIACESLP
ncbi:MAG TPA: excalibur calcium-binding domain-containing protein, partial [Deinococcales bacterium]|nr:excalibur calcium-binding domain-containing protein [Deinococcales bacterium]